MSECRYGPPVPTWFPTNVLGQIIRLKEKVRTQEESKTELLNQYGVTGDG